jgi:hypothetical protein
VILAVQDVKGVRKCSKAPPGAAEKVFAVPTAQRKTALSISINARSIS